MKTKKIEILYLNEKDMLRSGVDNMDACVCSMEDVFVLLKSKDYRMAGRSSNDHGAMIKFPKESNILNMPLDAPDYRFGALPAYLGGRFHVAGVKTYGSHHTNIQKGLPRSVLMMSLLDADTGVPISYMSANILSAMRTGAVAGVGAKYLSKKTPKTLAIIGPGVMSSYALKAIMGTQPSIETIKVNGIIDSATERFIEHVYKEYPLVKNCCSCKTIKEVCEDADIVFFGTSNSGKYEDNPRIEAGWLSNGSLVISISALLLPECILSDHNTVLVADNYQMYKDWGEGAEFPTQKNVSTLLGMGFYDAVLNGAISNDSIIDMGTIVTGDKAARSSDEQIVIFAVGGMPVEDVAWAYDCYQRAKESQLGTKLLLWEESEM